jgi:dTDP-4-amino-4,6-dideoxygalactose transaminase
VVTKDVPANAVVAGNPAKVLRYIEKANPPQKPEGVPFLDLITPHQDLENELVSIFRHSLENAHFVGGPLVGGFEKAFAEFSNCSHAIGVGSGTDALLFAIIASGVEAGEVILTVPNTFIATAEAISQARAIPEFIDVDERTYNMSIPMLERYLEKGCVRDKNGRLLSLRSGRIIAAILPVHLYGQMADMDAILDLADKYGLTVIEDACQAHGAEYFSKRNNCWMKAGSMGRAAAFSFYPGKNLGALGEGGAVTTNDAEVAEKIRMLRDHGQVKKYFHEVEGYNGRLDAIQAGFLLAKLPYLAEWNQQRRMCAERYNRLLANNHTVVLPYEPSWSRAIYHLYVIRTSDRDGLIEFLKTKNIGTGIHYPVPLHEQKPYASLNYTSEDLPIASRLAKEIVSLPMFPQLTEEQQATVVSKVQAFVAAEAASII